MAMNFHRCTGIVSAWRPRLFSLSDLKKQFTKSTEHPGFLLRKSAPSLGVCVCPYTHIVKYGLAQHTPIKSLVHFQEEIAILKILMERDVTSCYILLSFTVIEQILVISILSHTLSVCIHIYIYST